MLSKDEVAEAATHDIMLVLDLFVTNAEVLELNEDQKSFQLAIGGHLVTVSVEAE